MTDTRKRELLNLVRDFYTKASLADPIELARALQSSGIHASPSEIAALVAMTVRHAGANYVPTVILKVITQILTNKKSQIVCDPWAGLGAIIAEIEGTLSPGQTLAFTPNHQDAAVGRLIADKAQWRVGDSLELLS